MPRPAVVFLLIIACGACGAACGPSAHRPPAGPPPSGVVQLRCTVPDATIWIDEALVGLVGDIPKGGIRLTTGAHRIELRHERYHTRYIDVTLAPGELRRIEVTLAEVLD